MRYALTSHPLAFVRRFCVCVCCGRRSAAVGVARVTCHGGGDQLLTEYKPLPVQLTSVSELNFSLQLTIKCELNANMANGKGKGSKKEVAKALELPEGTEVCAWHACLVPVGDDPKRHIQVCPTHMRFACQYCPKRTSAETEIKEHILRRHAVEAKYLGVGQTGFKLDQRTAKEMLQAAISSGHVTLSPPVVAEGADVTRPLSAPKGPIPRVTPVETEKEVRPRDIGLHLGTEMDDVQIFDIDELLEQDEEEEEVEGYDPMLPGMQVSAVGTSGTSPFKPASFATSGSAGDGPTDAWERLVQQQQAHIADLQATIAHQRATIDFLVGQCGSGKALKVKASSSVASEMKASETVVPPAKVPRLEGAAGVLVPHIMKNVLDTLQASGSSSARAGAADEGRGRGRGFGRGRGRGFGGWRDLDMHCYVCGGQGHTSAVCPSRKQDEC